MQHEPLPVHFHTLAAGPVELAALPNHRVMIHASAPVRVLCHRTSYLYTRGQIDLVPAGYGDAWHHYADSRSLVVQISPELLQTAARDLGLDPERATLAPRHQLHDPQIEHIGWALDADRQAGSPAGRLYADSLGLALAAHLLGRFGETAVTAAAAQQRGLTAAQLGNVTSYIEAHLDRDLSLQRLATVAQVSPSHLKSAFRRSTGLPVHAYVVQQRVERAKQLLLKRELPASEVALEAGFAHQSHMARCMRRVLGVTPSVLVKRRAIAADGGKGLVPIQSDN